MMKNGKVNGSIGLDNQDLGLAEVWFHFADYPVFSFSDHAAK